MQTKQKDILYCGVDKHKIINAKPELNLDTFRKLYTFINERYKVHILKDVEQRPAPWTNDEIIANYRFTNVRREHDKETKWLIDHIVNSRLTIENKLLNILCFRYYNKHETAELLKLPIDFQNYDWNNFVNTMPEDVMNYEYDPTAKGNTKRTNDIKLWNSAFMTAGMKGAVKTYCPKDQIVNPSIRIFYLIKYLIEQSFPKKILSTKNQKECYELISAIKGFGGFMAYQIFVDFTYINEFPFSENEFVISGPGCSSGLGFLFVDKDGMNNEECLFWLRNNIDNLFRKLIDNEWNPVELFSDLPLEDRYLNVMSLENCFCELSKYVKIGQGKGRRRKYNPIN